MNNLVCGFKAVNNKHCISEDGKYCVVCKEQV